METIITLDATSSGVPEDGFGIDKSGNFFIAISKGGFYLGKKSIIFIFEGKKIIVKNEFVIVQSIYKVDNFADAVSSNNNYHFIIFERLFHIYCYIKGVNIKNHSIKDDRHVNCILSRVLGYIYKRLGFYFSCKRVNLKQRMYKKVYLMLEDSSLVL